MTTPPLDRRDFLRVAAAGAAGLMLAPAFAADEKDPYAGFKMGIQSYSLRGFKVDQALEHTKTLGLKYWESFSGHLPITAVPKVIADQKKLSGHLPITAVPKVIADQKKLLADAGVTILSYGVLGFDANETKSREIFDYAKAMGLKAISADPAKDKATFDLLDKLVAEYDIAIAIHNHGPKHRYDKISDVWDMVKDRHPKIGACVDTGHYLKSDEDPVKAIDTFGKKTFGVHLKDAKNIDNNGKKEKKFTIIGEGDLDILGCLKSLKALKYEYILAIEYEENPENPMSDLEVGLKNVRAQAAKVA
jgi:sugar phosphate isomerase/epimerase